MANNPVPCNTCKANGMTTMIYFDNRIKSTSGKMIPQEVATNKNHSCPFRQGNKPTTAPAAVQQTAPQVNNEPRINTTPTGDILLAVARVEDAVKKQQAQLDRIEQVVAGLLIQPTGGPTAEIPTEQEA